MRKKHKLAAIVIILIFAALIVALINHLQHYPPAVLDPKGPVAEKERSLIIFGSLLSLVVVIPVFGLLFGFVWRYRETNTKAKYSPELDHSRIAETIWWLIPGILILILSIVAWDSSHQLDPYKPLASNKQPLDIQVVALDWKWLFIYPQQHIASVNFFQFPSNTPLNFEITSDAPMNSFWIPQLGGQIYAMAGMSTQLHLEASVNGSFHGSSANISGQGFSGMTFIAKATSQKDFELWVNSVKQSNKDLSLANYNKLSEPTSNYPITYYTADYQGLYDTIIDKYMVPGGQTSNTSGAMSGMSME